MSNILKYEARQRIRGSITLVILLGFFTLLVVQIYPSIVTASGSLEAYFEALPEPFQESFALESFTTIEGFLAAEVYQFVWLLLVGLYLAYLASGTIAGDIESGRMDLLLATSVSRTRVIVEKYLSLFVPIFVLNLVLPLFVFGGVIAIGESISLSDLVLLHVVSIPYLLLTSAIGLTLSVLFNRTDIAQRGSLAIIFLLFILDSVTAGTNLEWLGDISPTRYFSPIDILIDSKVDISGTFILLIVALILVILSADRFKRIDI